MNFFVLNTASLNAYWQTVHGYARSIYVARSIFQQRLKKRASRASIEPFKFFKKEFFRPSTAICLIERAEDNFQAVKFDVKSDDF